MLSEQRRKPRAGNQTRTRRASNQTRTWGRRQSPKGTKASKKRKRRKRSKKKRNRGAILSVAYRLILHIDWKGKILTGDAFYCQRCLCAAILLAGGDYWFLVKANQPHLFLRSALVVCPPCPCQTSRGRDLAITRTTSSKH